MSLDNLKLPDFIIAELYKDSLVELENSQYDQEEPQREIAKELTPEEPKTEKTPLKFLGKNKKNIVVVVSEPKALIINEEELEFLTKILTACRLNIADIAIVNNSNQKVVFQDLKDQLNARFILMLGVEPESIKLPFTIPAFQVQPFADTTIFHTPSLSKMLPNNQESKLLKSKLWLSLKTAFDL